MHLNRGLCASIPCFPGDLTITTGAQYHMKSKNLSVAVLTTLLLSYAMEVSDAGDIMQYICVVYRQIQCNDIREHLVVTYLPGIRVTAGAWKPRSLCKAQIT
jgi:hypothetical protein